jgi:isocitrate/isopropylmalate dehydrogenase
MMLHHMGEHEAAEKIAKGLLSTFERGIRTGDLGGTANTEEFTRALCEAVGRS